MICRFPAVELSKLVAVASVLLLPAGAQGQPPFWHNMFAVATTDNSLVGLSHQRCPYMKAAYDAEAISWYASGAVFHNHACWAPDKKLRIAIDLCVFANLQQRPICVPKRKDEFVDARDFHLPRGAFL